MTEKLDQVNFDKLIQTFEDWDSILSEPECQQLYGPELGL